jgi:two-component system, sensor histidine kinase
MKNLELSYFIEQNFPLSFLSDENRLRQILINLISNAIKYTEEGYVRIRCQYDNKKQEASIEVEDSGVGIEEKEMPNLFDAYIKIKKNRDLNKHGCGLGLTISKNLAMALGGDIKVYSKVNVGSVFAI